MADLEERRRAAAIELAQASAVADGRFQHVVRSSNGRYGVVASDTPEFVRPFTASVRVATVNPQGGVSPVAETRLIEFSDIEVSLLVALIDEKVLAAQAYEQKRQREAEAQGEEYIPDGVGYLEALTNIAEALRGE